MAISICGRVSHTGQVVALDVKQWMDGSDDLIALVWDGAKVERVTYARYGASCACGCDHSNDGASVDATPETLAAYRAHCAASSLISTNHDIQYGRVCPSKGDTVTVVRGRKVAKGITGMVAWTGNTQFGYRLGLDTASGRVWVDAKNVALAA